MDEFVAFPHLERYETNSLSYNSRTGADGVRPGR
jgi:hypothetical protein